jgi:hypothetical protein
MSVVIHTAVLSTISSLRQKGPSILRTNLKGLPRLQAWPGPKDTSGPHFDGRALDIVLLSDRDSECSIADQLVECFLNFRESIEWEALIYNREQWDSSGAKSARMLTPSITNPGRDFEHRTHIHMQWPKHKKQLDYTEQVTQALADSQW